MTIQFITRNTDGKLQQNLGEWDAFKEQLLNLPNTTQELQFLGQLIEDLLFTYEDKMEELRENK